MKTHGGVLFWKNAHNDNVITCWGLHLFIFLSEKYIFIHLLIFYAMKHSLFFHSIALVCALMTVTALQAQDDNVYCPSGKYDPNVIHFNSFDQMDQVETLNQVKQIPRKAEGG